MQPESFLLKERTTSKQMHRELNSKWTFMGYLGYQRNLEFWTQTGHGRLMDSKCIKGYWNRAIECHDQSIRVRENGSPINGTAVAENEA